MKKVLFILCLVLFTSKIFGQVKLGVYTKNVLGVEVNFSNKISSELRFKEVNHRDSFGNEVLLFYRVFTKEYYGIKMGAGIDLYVSHTDPVKSLIFPVQFEIVPVKKFKYLSLVVEPSFFVGVDSGAYFRNLVGLKIRL